MNIHSSFALWMTGSLLFYGNAGRQGGYRFHSRKRLIHVAYVYAQEAGALSTPRPKSEKV